MASQRGTRQLILTGSSRIADLTTRQAEVLELAAHGLSGKQIGRYLGISVRTVEGHFSEMRRRTGTSSACELIAYGVTAGLLTPGPAPPRRRASRDQFPTTREAVGPGSHPSAGKRPIAGTPGHAANPQEKGVGNTRRISTPDNLQACSFRQMLLGYARVST